MSEKVERERGRFLAGFVAGVVFLACLSCSKQETSEKTQVGAKSAVNSEMPMQAQTNATAKTILEMAPSDVIVSVNGEVLTKAKFDEGVKRLVDRMTQATKAKQQQAASIVRIVTKMYVPRFVSTQLMVQEARRTNVLPKQDLETKVDEVIGRVAKKSGKGAKDFLASVPGGEAAFRKEAEELFLVEALLQTNVWPQVNVTDDFVAAARETIIAERRAIEATNSVRIAKLNEIRKEILAGGDFGKLADQYSQCSRSVPGNKGYWSRFERNEFSDVKMRSAIFSLKPGEVSEVLENEEGFHLVKMLRYIPAVKNQKGVVTQNETVELAHILLRRAPAIDPSMQSDLKAQLIQQLRQKKADAYIEALKSKAAIFYPHGTNFWEKSSPLPGVIKNTPGNN